VLYLDSWTIGAGGIFGGLRVLGRKRTKRKSVNQDMLIDN